MIRSPPASSLPAGALPSPNSAIRPSAKAIQPCSITRSARTILALPMTVSDPVEVMSMFFLQAADANDVTSTMRSAIRWRTSSSWTMATMATPARFFSVDQFDHHGAVGGIERGGRLVQQQDRQIGDEAARDVDALLLAAGEGRGRQRPQPLRNVEPAQQLPCPLLRLRDAPCRSTISGSATTSMRGDPRHRAQELADIADGGAAHAEDLRAARRVARSTSAPWWRMPMRPPSQR